MCDLPHGKSILLEFLYRMIRINMKIGRKGKNTLINASLLFTITKKAHQEIGKLLNLSKSMIADIKSRAEMI